MTATVQSDAEVYVFRALFQFATALSIFIHLYNLFLMLRVTPGSLNDYRHILVSVNVLSLLFVITVGIFMQPLSLLPFPCTSVQGVFKSFGNGGAEVVLLMSVVLGICCIALQSFCLLYRFVAVRRIQPLLTRKPWFILALAVLLLFGGATGTTTQIMLFGTNNVSRMDVDVYAATQFQVYPGFETTAESANVTLKDAVRSTDSAMFCIKPFASVPQMTLLTVLLPFGAIMVLCYLCCIISGLRTFVILRLKSTILSERMYRAHRTMTKYFLMQTMMPALCLLALLALIGLIVAVGSEFTAFTLELCIVIVLLWPLFSAFFTCLYISPYRRFSKLWLTRLWKGKAVSDTTITVSFSGGSNAQADTNISRRSMPNTPNQGMLSGRRLQDSIASRRVSRF